MLRTCEPCCDLYFQNLSVISSFYIQYLIFCPVHNDKHHLDTMWNMTGEYDSHIAATSVSCHWGFVSQIKALLPLALEWESDTLQLWRPLGQITFAACCLQQSLPGLDAVSDTACSTNLGLHGKEANIINPYIYIYISIYISKHTPMIPEQWDRWPSSINHITKLGFL